MTASAEAPEAVKAHFPSATEIAETPIPGLYAVCDGFRIQHVDEMGKFAFPIGDIVALGTGENLTEKQPGMCSNRDIVLRVTYGST